MENKIHYRPIYSMAEIVLQPGESVVVESGSMVAMSDNMEIKTSIGGTKLGFFGKIVAFFAALIRKFLGGESVFFNTYTPQGKEGKLFVAPSLAGDIVHKKLNGGGIYLQGTAFLASSPDVNLKTKWGGLRSLFGGEGLFLLYAQGSGDLWFNCYGAIQEIDVDGEYIVDTGHIVAFDENLTFKVTSVGGLKSTLFSGEGLVTRFSGRGKLYIQTHNLGALVNWVTPLLPR
ncbi:MAG: TIGR00266 family protein [Myxococcota bacterium]